MKMEEINSMLEVLSNSNNNIAKKVCVDLRKMLENVKKDKEYDNYIDKYNEEIDKIECENDDDIRYVNKIFDFFVLIIVFLVSLSLLYMTCGFEMMVMVGLMFGSIIGVNYDKVVPNFNKKEYNEVNKRMDNYYTLHKNKKEQIDEIRENKKKIEKENIILKERIDKNIKSLSDNMNNILNDIKYEYVFIPKVNDIDYINEDEKTKKKTRK